MNEEKIGFVKKYLKYLSNKSTCLRRKVSAFIEDEKGSIVSCGWNGAPEECASCEETGCVREQKKVASGTHHELCRGIHAEQFAINKAAKEGYNINNGTLYCTTYPCSMCAKSIISSGIRTVYYIEDYPDNLAKELFREAKITVLKI